MTANSTGAVKTARRAVAPAAWATDGIPLANSDVLELGSGPGLTADWLWPRVATLTAIEYDGADAAARTKQIVDPGLVRQTT
jgi:16S rRNA A1518/A1519 N6-dimethyltransferase RsmA/KsgA/DIM1 with predicted DNA glycosylase/AP lyase activity